jgi:hypothetical protein
MSVEVDRVPLKQVRPRDHAHVTEPEEMFVILFAAFAGCLTDLGISRFSRGIRSLTVTAP